MKPIQLFFLLVFLTLNFHLMAQNQSMTLIECIDMAIERNISVKLSELALNDAEINKDDAKGSFLPSLNACLSS